ncbi:MAG: TRAP transporter small permease [Pseudomonadota bacterium]
MVEHEVTGWMDRISLLIGRITMLLIAGIVCVMFYEVVLRYAFERPTLWANELSLWMAGFVFLFAGLYAMQQRSHIRIFLLYDVLPRGVQKTCDVISTGLIVLFAAAMVYGGFGEAYAKLMRWETFGTAFDPPIPATLKPAILLIIVLVAIQAVSNLIMDWNKAPESHLPVDDIEEVRATFTGQTGKTD